MAFSWDRCIICQKISETPLKCPLNANTTDIERMQVYKNFLENAHVFQSQSSLPVELKLDLSTATVELLIANKASWHKSCRLKFTSSKLEKAKQRQSQKRKRETEEEEAETRRNSKRRQASKNDVVCIFCDKGSDEILHDFTSLTVDEKIRDMAKELEDFELLSRMSRGDLVAIDAKYHIGCLTKFRNSYRSLKRKEDNMDEDSLNEMMNESRAFVELTTYIEKSVDEGILLFKLSEIHAMYEARLRDLGIPKQINKTRLKTSLLDHFSDAQEQHDGKHIVIVFKEAMHSLLKDALKKRDVSDDANNLAKVASIVRKDILEHKGFSFAGCFPFECQEKSIPTSLRSLVSMIINGLNLKDQNHCESQACLTVCQSIIFNINKRPSESSSSKPRHVAPREPPLPLYIGFNIHSLTRSRTLITRLYQLGLSVSYDRILEIEDWLATSVSERFEEDNCVCPANLRTGLFSVAALDNIDHNPSSTTASSSFHGTSISIFQFPTQDKPGDCRPPLRVPPAGNQKHRLPESYANVPPVSLTATSVSVPKTNQLSSFEGNLDRAIAQENAWLKHSQQKIQGTLTSTDKIAWAAYHSTIRQGSQQHSPATVRALMPLFYEKAATPAMVKHGMDVIQDAITLVNPGQIPVIAFDQPLFTIAKTVQWKWPDTHGEGKFVVMLGGLHLEMALWNTLGDLLEGTGWTTAITEADIATSGVADSFLKASHLTRTR